MQKLQLYICVCQSYAWNTICCILSGHVVVAVQFLSITLQMQFMILFSRQGKLRLQKWYVAYADKMKKKIVRELVSTVLARKPKMSSFIEWKDMKIVYKRFFIFHPHNS